MRLLLLTTTIACGLCRAQAPPTVSVTGGKVRGSLTNYGGAVFKGIPFAQPPTGALRWREPLPVKPWTGTRDALAFGSPCVQSGALGADSNKTACI
jgi:para-nitrobenzyl esterase